MENAQNLMESEARWQQVLDGQKLFLDYSYGLPMSGAGGGGSAPTQDWICTECQAVNFSRWVLRVQGLADGAPAASACVTHAFKDSTTWVCEHAVCAASCSAIFVHCTAALMH